MGGNRHGAVAVGEPTAGPAALPAWRRHRHAKISTSPWRHQRLAGNLTILGSVANIIVVESARGHAEVGFWDYAKVGIPVTILTTVAGMVIPFSLN